MVHCGFVTCHYLSLLCLSVVSHGTSCGDECQMMDAAWKCWYVLPQVGQNMNIKTINVSITKDRHGSQGTNRTDFCHSLNITLYYYHQVRNLISFL